MIRKLSSNHLSSAVRRQANKHHARRGATIVEFALSFLLFLLVILTLLEIGRGIWTYTTLAQATRQAGRYCIISGSENPTTIANIETVVKRHCKGLNLPDVSVNCVWNPEDATPKLDPAQARRGDILQIRVNYPFRLITSPLVLAQSTIQMGSTSRMLVAN